MLARALCGRREKLLEIRQKQDIFGSSLVNTEVICQQIGQNIKDQREVLSMELTELYNSTQGILVYFCRSRALKAAGNVF